MSATNQRRLRRWVKRLNPLRVWRFYNRGYAELGRIISRTHARNDAGVEQAIRRANWIHNLVRHGQVFKGSL